jgi:hypothetical protein
VGLILGLAPHGHFLNLDRQIKNILLDATYRTHSLKDVICSRLPGGEEVAREQSEGRPCAVLAWHTGLL